MRNKLTTLIALGFLGLVTDLYRAVPNVESVDYANAQKYLAFPDSLGDRAAILQQAKKLKGESDLTTIRNVLVWMDQNLKYDGTKAYQWRNYDDVLREKAYGGCADQAIVCGVLLKGSGIPVVWVKSMDVSWIWDFKKGRPFTSWSGHVFLEVFIQGKWSLLDPGAKTVYQNYSPKMRILSGQRLAYHKGNDPKDMIMSLQWEEWKRQTETYFREMDEALLPVDEKDATALLAKAYVIGNSPYYQAMTQMAVESGLQVVRSFNAEYDNYLPEAQGHVLLIETHKGKPILPGEVLERYYPKALSGISCPSKRIRIKDTSIVFIEFSEQLQGISGIEDKEKGTTNKTDAGNGK